MATRYLMIDEEKESLVYDEVKIAVSKFASLFPTDGNDEISFGKEGKYQVEATIEFPNLIINSLTELWSFEEHSFYNLDEDDANLGTIKYQVSNNNGTTFLYWNGAAWSVAGVNDWNTEEEIQNNISTLSFIAGGYKQIKIKALLSPDIDGLSSPCLWGVAIHYEIDFIPEEDVVRSVYTYLDGNLKVITDIGAVLASITGSIIANMDAEILEVIGVWSETDDPGHLNNIYLSLVKTLVETKETGEEVYSQIINFTPQAANSEIIARLRVKINIRIAPAKADYVLASLPQFVLELGDHNEDSNFKNDDRKIEKNKAKLLARVRNFPSTYRLPITIISYSSDERLSEQMNRAAIRLLKNNRILSLATSEYLKIVNTIDFANKNISREGLSVKQFVFELIYRDFDPNYEEVPLAETIQFETDRGGRR